MKANEIAFGKVPTHSGRYILFYLPCIFLVVLQYGCDLDFFVYLQFSNWGQ